MTRRTYFAVFPLYCVKKRDNIDLLALIFRWERVFHCVSNFLIHRELLTFRVGKITHPQVWQLIDLKVVTDQAKKKDSGEDSGVLEISAVWGCCWDYEVDAEPGGCCGVCGEVVEVPKWLRGRGDVSNVPEMLRGLWRCRIKFYYICSQIEFLT